MGKNIKLGLVGEHVTAVDCFISHQRQRAATHYNVCCHFMISSGLKLMGDIIGNDVAFSSSFFWCVCILRFGFPLLVNYIKKICHNIVER